MCSFKKELGQYFTTNKLLQQKVLDYILNDSDTILEPSFGHGDLVKYVLMGLKKKGKNVYFDMFEIDDSLTLLAGLNNLNYEYCDFLKMDIKKKYKTVIGNPPFVKDGSSNLYIKFIKKCFKLLELNGELIFIIPSSFFKLTMSNKLLKKMLRYGSFTHIFHPNKENLFENASIDILIFRYVRNPLLDKIVLFDDSNTIKKKYIINSDGMITFSNKLISCSKKFEDLFDIYVGLVSGKEKVFKNNVFGNICILKNEKNVCKYIYIKKYPTDDDKLNKYLLSHKKSLINRKIKKFDEKNWFEWGALRNIKKMEEHRGKKCIYVMNITRQKNIAFKGNVQYFGGGLIMLQPKKYQNGLIKKTLSYLNSNDFKKKFTYSNRFKIGHRQLSKSLFNI